MEVHVQWWSLHLSLTNQYTYPLQRWVHPWCIACYLDGIWISRQRSLQSLINTFLDSQRARINGCIFSMHRYLRSLQWIAIRRPILHNLTRRVVTLSLLNLSQLLSWKWKVRNLTTPLFPARMGALKPNWYVYNIQPVMIRYSETVVLAEIASWGREGEGKCNRQRSHWFAYFMVLQGGCLVHIEVNLSFFFYL